MFWLQPSPKKGRDIRTHHVINRDRHLPPQLQVVELKLSHVVRPPRPRKLAALVVHGPAAAKGEGGALEGGVEALAGARLGRVGAALALRHAAVVAERGGEQVVGAVGKAAVDALPVDDGAHGEGVDARVAGTVLGHDEQLLVGARATDNLK